MTTTDDTAGWTPVRKGRTYCSPRCGGGCTHAEFIRATKAADKLCAELGAGWKPRVFENLGWHFSAQKADAEVFQNKAPNMYYTMFWGSDPQLLIDAVTPAKLLVAASKRITDLRADLAARQMAVLG